ncbi:hypothetical protein D7V97_16935 [Corallococcus sp. CA053C]|nr:hypothetical protein D7V97_16935 [Corallococcus sp. CA053C]
MVEPLVFAVLTMRPTKAFAAARGESSQLNILMASWTNALSVPDSPFAMVWQSWSMASSVELICASRLAISASPAVREVDVVVVLGEGRHVRVQGVGGEGRQRGGRGGGLGDAHVTLLDEQVDANDRGF